MEANIGRFIGGISFGIFADTTPLNRNLGRGRKSIDNFVKGGSRLMGIFGVGVGGATVTSAIYKSAAAFETLNRSMTKSLSIMENVSEKLRGNLKAAAIDVARTTNFTASQSADAYRFLASAGYDAESSLAVMPQLAKFAQAGMFDLSEATNYVADSQSALGLKSKDARKNLESLTRITDVLTEANNLANGEVRDFAVALTNGAGASLKVVGKDIEEGAAVLAAFADQGVKGEAAGTAFSIVMRDLQTQALKNVDAFKKAGVAVYDQSGDMRNLADIVSDLEGRLSGLSDAGKKFALMQLGFTDKSIKFTQSLIGTSDKIREYEAALRGAGGTTAEVASKMMTPLETAMNQLKGAFTDAAQAMEPLVTMAADLVGYFAKMVDYRFNPDDLQSSRKKATDKGSFAEFNRGFELYTQDAPSTWNQFSGAMNYWTGGRLGSTALFQAGPKDFGAQGLSTHAQGPLEGAYNAIVERFQNDLSAMAQSPVKGQGMFGGVGDFLKRGSQFAANQVTNMQSLGKQSQSAAMERDKANFEKLKGMYDSFMGSEAGIQLGRAVEKHLGAFQYDVGRLGRNLGMDTAMTGMRHIRNTVTDGVMGKNKRQYTPAPTLAETGSAEAVAQRVRIQNRDSQRLEPKKVSLLSEIAKNTAKPKLVMATANLTR